MREVRITVLDPEFEYLTKIKNKFHCKSWHNFVMLAATVLASKGGAKNNES